MTPEDVEPRDDLAELLDLGTRLGVPGPVRPQDHGIELESAAAFVARMKAKDSHEADEATPEVSARRSPLRRPAVRLLVAAAAVVVIAGLVVASPWSRPSARADTPPILQYELAKATDIAFAPGQDARANLLDLAQAARATGSVTPGAGDVEYVQTDNWFVSQDDDGSSATSRIIPTIVQTWTSADGAQTVVESPGAELGTDGRGLSVRPQSGASSKQQQFPPGSGKPDAVEQLGSTSREVRDSLIRSGGCETDASATARAQCLYQEVSNLFNQTVVPGTTAAAIWAALADEPGFRSLGTVTDRAGRPGLGISVVSDAAPEFRYVLIISRTTGQLLGKEEILIRSNADLSLRAPAVYSFTAYLSSELVARRPTR